MAKVFISLPLLPYRNSPLSLHSNNCTNRCPYDYSRPYNSRIFLAIPINIVRLVYRKSRRWLGGIGGERSLQGVEIHKPMSPVTINQLIRPVTFLTRVREHSLGLFGSKTCCSSKQ